MKKIFNLHIVIGYGEIDYKTEGIIIEPFYIGNQISSRIILDENEMEGYVALDYITGYFIGDTLQLTIYDFNENEKMNFIGFLGEEPIKDNLEITLASRNETDLFCMILLKELPVTREILDTTYANIQLAKQFNHRSV